MHVCPPFDFSMVLSCNVTILLRQTLFFKYFMCFSLTYFRFENLYQIGDGAWRKSQSPGGHATLSLPLRFAAKILYELCLGVFLCLTKPAFMRRPWRITPCPAVHGWAFLGFIGIILQLLSCFAIRGRKGATCPPGLCDLRPLRCEWV